MNRRRCETVIKPPPIELPDVAFNDEELAILKALARELAGKVAAADASNARTRACRSTRIAAQRLHSMRPQAKRTALSRARKLAEGGEGRGDRGSDPALAERLHKLIRSKTRDTHKGFFKAVAHVKDEIGRLRPILPATSVLVLPDSELNVPARREYCDTLPTVLVAEWETNEPGAARIYWELRGPKDSQGNLQYIDHGYAENQRDDGTVGGSFLLDMTHYAPLVTPVETAEYHVSVLPLASIEGLMMGYWGGGVVGNLAVEPEPPTGLGPWSPPAIIRIGEECGNAPTIFDIRDIDYYRKLRINIDWFRVDVDQPGPGGEEYHLSAFILKSATEPMWDGAHYEDVSFIKSLGRWESYFSVAEGDNRKIPFSWSSPQVYLPGPNLALGRWPSFSVILSVMEEDGGESVEDFYEMMDELFQDALHGSIADQLADIQREVEEIVDEARAELHETLVKEMWAYIAGIVGAALINAIAGIVAAAAAIIGAWIRAGEVDDFYGVRVLHILLKSNDLAELEANNGWVVKCGGTLVSGGNFTGQREGGQFISDDIAVQLIAVDSPDAAGLDGRVSVGLSLEYSDLRTTTL